MSTDDNSSAPPEVGLLDVEEEVAPEIVLAGEDVGGAEPSARAFFKLGSAIATLVSLIVATYLVPSLDWARPWTTQDPVPFWNIIGREILGEGEAEEQAEEQLSTVQALARAVDDELDVAPIEDRVVAPPPPEGEVAGPPPPKPHPDDALDVPHSLELPDPGALDRFFARLERTDAGYAGAVTRVVHWGDSVLGTDNVTSTLREKMQRRFGDAGHGFHLLAKNNASYRHRGVRFGGGTGWSVCHIINGCKKDGHYGLGATTVISKGPARSKFSTPSDSPNGRRVSKFEVWFAATSGGGRIKVRVDHEPEVVIDTNLVDSERGQLEDRWHVVEMEDGPHDLTVVTEGGRVRAYGVVMERDVPGVVWDGMSQVGAFASRMLYFDTDHLRRQIEHRDPALLVFQFGGNDLQLKASQRDRFARQYAQMLRNFRGEDEPLACLVVSPVDHGVRQGHRIVSVDAMTWVTESLREVALAEGCAFFDTRAAMGGEGSVARWYAAKPPLISGDLSHLTNAGQKALGQLLYLALMEQYRAYRSRTRTSP